MPESLSARLLPRLLAAAAAAVALTACSNEPPQDTSCGKPTREELVAGYVAGLNAGDRDQVRRLVEGSGLDLDADAKTKIDTAVDQRLTAFGGKDITIEKQSFSDTVPYVSEAKLTGTGGYAELLPLNRPQDRPNWCLSIRDLPPVTGPASSS